MHRFLTPSGLVAAHIEILTLIDSVSAAYYLVNLSRLVQTSSCVPSFIHSLSAQSSSSACLLFLVVLDVKNQGTGIYWSSGWCTTVTSERLKIRRVSCRP
jgi:hypothetical protein